MSSDFPTRISFAEALRILDQVASSARLDVERVPLARGLGRVLASDVVSAIELPSFDNAAMDGFALRADDLREPVTPLQLVGEQFAGASLGLAITAGQCLRIRPSGVSMSTMRPRSMIATRSHNRSASSIRCVVRNTVFPLSRIPRTSSQIARRD